MKYLFLSALLMSSLSLFADGFKTSGNGTTYSFAKLSETAGSSVTKLEGNNAYMISGSDTIATEDYFEIDPEGIVYFVGEAELIIKGKANLVAGSNGIKLAVKNSEDKPHGIEVSSNDEIVNVGNITFEGVGLKNYSSAGMNVSNCSFIGHNGTSSGALFLGTDGATFTVTDCSFSLCEKAAIGGAANFFCPITIKNCNFYKNSQANGNIPQLNLTAASDVTISNCIVEGDPQLNMVGGIGVSNFYGTEGHHITIDKCHIFNNRYGFTSMGVMDVVLTDNIIENNCYETNPNNGGSGISLYDPYLKQTAIISGNTIKGNLWGITVIGCGDVNIGRTDVEQSDERYNRGENIFADNGFDGQLYDLYNNSANDVYAQNNLWGVEIQDQEHIEQVIFHKHDDPSLGEVFFLPAASEALSIENPTSLTLQNDHYFNLNGQRMSQPLRGINIIGGKKIIVK